MALDCLFLQELHCLPNCLHVGSSELLVSITSPSFITLDLLVSEILPEVAYCCFSGISFGKACVYQVSS